MLFLVISTPAPGQPSEMWERRQAYWRWIDAVRAKGCLREVYSRAGRGAVAIFDVADNAALHARKRVRWLQIVVLLVLALACMPEVRGEESLAALGARLTLAREGISLSGVSSGGYMAQQFHVAHSSQVHGVGILAAGPYRCAAGVYRPYSWFDASGLYAATSRCSNTSEYWFYQGPPDLAVSLRETRAEAAVGGIDDPRGMRGDRVWLFSGGADRTVPSSVVDVLERYYRHFVDARDIEHVHVARAGHAMITVDRGNACGVSAAPYINDCDFDAAGELLAHVYGTLRAPALPDAVHAAIAFEQSAFFDRADRAISLHDTGFVYVPPQCLEGTRCRLHVAFHGCRQQYERVGDAFHAGAGYNRWARTNDLVVLYPQTTASRGGWFEGGANPRACWDWWGFSGDAYHRKTGPQMRAVAAMIDALLGARVFTAP